MKKYTHIGYLLPNKTNSNKKFIPKENLASLKLPLARHRDLTKVYIEEEITQLPGNPTEEFLDAVGKTKYNDYVNRQDIHSNRFPSWEELSDTEKRPYKTDVVIPIKPTPPPSTIRKESYRPSRPDSNKFMDKMRGIFK